VRRLDFVHPEKNASVLHYILSEARQNLDAYTMEVRTCQRCLAERLCRTGLSCSAGITP
jgi:hypothetical protein